jgi:hypothetical protein
MRKPETTGIGSLPFHDPETAVSHVFSSYSVPFFPQLVQHAHYKKTNAPQMLQEAVPAQILDVLLNDRRADPTRLREEWRPLITEHVASLPAMAEFLSRLRQHRGPLYKLQLCGPLTATRIITHLTGGSPVPEVIAVLTDLLVETAHQFVVAAQAANTASCLFIWDEGVPLTEPSPDHSAAMATLLHSLASDRVQTGVHCCAPFHPDAFLAFARDHWLAADLTMLDLADDSVVSVLQRIRQSGGLIAGIVDTSATAVNQAQVRNLCKKLGSLTQTSGTRPLLVSGGCGTGPRTEAFEHDLVRALVPGAL